MSTEALELYIVLLPLPLFLYFARFRYLDIALFSVLKRRQVQTSLTVLNTLK